MTHEIHPDVVHAARTGQDWIDNDPTMGLVREGRWVSEGGFLIALAVILAACVVLLTGAAIVTHSTWLMLGAFAVWVALLISAVKDRLR